MVDLSLIKPQHLWYTIGLITTDGNLSKDGRHITIVSKDRRLLINLKKALYLKNKIGRKGRGENLRDKIYSILQIGDKKFYNFLLTLGLCPKKSLSLKMIRVPDMYFADFLRGVIDGDGNISSWIHRSNGNRQWSLRIFSAAPKFSFWIIKEIQNKFRVNGRIHEVKKNNRNCLYHIKFGKFATKIILKKCYYKNCLALGRKFKKALQCIKSKNGLSKYGNVVSIAV